MRLLGSACLQFWAPPNRQSALSKTKADCLAIHCRQRRPESLVENTAFRGALRKPCEADRRWSQPMCRNSLVCWSHLARLVENPKLAKLVARPLAASATQDRRLLYIQSSNHPIIQSEIGESLRYFRSLRGAPSLLSELDKRLPWLIPGYPKDTIPRSEDISPETNCRGDTSRKNVFESGGDAYTSRNNDLTNDWNSRDM